MVKTLAAQRDTVVNVDVTRCFVHHLATEKITSPGASLNFFGNPKLVYSPPVRNCYKRQKRKINRDLSFNQHQRVRHQHRCPFYCYIPPDA